MALLNKKTLLLLLTVVLIAHFPTAYMLDKTCSISNARHSTNHHLYMKSASNYFLVAYTFKECPTWNGFMGLYKSWSKDCSEWIFYKWKVAGKTYYEIYNVLMKKYVGVDQSTACGNYEGYIKTNSTLTLFTIEPFVEGVSVYIKSFNGEFLSEPMTRMSHNVALYKYKKTHWIIRCK